MGIQSSFSSSNTKNGFNNINVDSVGNIGSAYNDAYRAAPIIPSIVNGKYGNTSAYQNVGNPLLDLKDNSVSVTGNRIQGTTYLNLKPLSWLTFRSVLGGDFQNFQVRRLLLLFRRDRSNNQRQCQDDPKRFHVNL